MGEKKQENKFNLTEGGILSKLLLVSLPIMGTQVVQMTYNLTDMFWLGRVGANAVAASGTVGMYIWLSNAFMIFGKTGGEIGVAQNLGRDDMSSAKKYAQSSFTISVILGLLFGLVLMLGSDILVGFFNIQETDVISQAKSYLFIVSIGIPFTFVTSAVTGIFNGSGNSGTPFIINAVGLVINMILDPVLIFTFDMGIEGAAIATIIAQVVAGILSVLALLLSVYGG